MVAGMTGKTVVASSPLLQRRRRGDRTGSTVSTAVKTISCGTAGSLVGKVLLLVARKEFQSGFHVEPLVLGSLATAEGIRDSQPTLRKGCIRDEAAPASLHNIFYDAPRLYLVQLRLPLERRSFASCEPALSQARVSDGLM